MTNNLTTFLYFIAYLAPLLTCQSNSNIFLSVFVFFSIFFFLILTVFRFRFLFCADAEWVKTLVIWFVFPLYLPRTKIYFLQPFGYSIGRKITEKYFVGKIFAIIIIYWLDACTLYAHISHAESLNRRKKWLPLFQSVRNNFNWNAFIYELWQEERDEPGYASNACLSNIRKLNFIDGNNFFLLFLIG